MELVKGVSLTQYCDEQRLSPHKRLELFVSVCQAVHHAHQKGVIHRDLKPSNILVAEYDGRPVPKIIDFGVAKAISQTLTEKTMFTQFGQIVGTLEYMSPEQARLNQLDIDTRSDVYSLGVVLYELLAGATPFDRRRLRSAAFDELLRIIREEEPPRPSTRLSTIDTLASVAANRGTEPQKLGRMLRGELDWIVMKAMEKERARRYEGANALAADVERYLADEPVVACPPSAVYRLGKFARRHRAALTMSSLVALALLATVGSIGWMVRDRAARAEEIAHERAEQQQLSEQFVVRALDLSTEYLHEGQWQQSLAEARRAEAAAAGGSVGDEVRARVAERLADLKTAMQLDEMRTVAPESPLSHSHQARFEAFAQTFREYGIDIEKLDAQEAAQWIKRREIRLELALALDSAVRATLPKASGDNLRRQQAKMLSIAQAVDSDAWRNRLRRLIEKQDIAGLVQLSQSPEAVEQPAASVSLLARVLLDAEQCNAAAELLLKGQRRHRGDFRIAHLLGCALQSTSPPRIDEALRFDQAAAALRPTSPGLLVNLGVGFRFQNRLDEAVVAFRDAIAVGGPGWKWTGAHVQLGLALQAQGKFDEAIASFRTAAEVVPKEAPRLQTLIGDVLQTQGKTDEAIAAYRKALAQDPKSTFAHHNLGMALGRQKKFDEAMACYRKALECDPELADIHNSIGAALERQGRLDEAIASYRKALEGKPKLAAAHANLGQVLTKQGRLDEAIASYRKALEADPKLATAHSGLGNALLKQKSLDAAIASLRKALECDPKLAAAHNNLGNALLEQKSFDAAIASFRKAVECDPKLAVAHNNLGVALENQGRFDDALAGYHKALECEPGLALAHHNIGRLRNKQGRLDEAIASYRKAVQCDPKHLAAHNNLGLVLLEQKSFDAAIASLRRAIEVDPKYAIAHGNLGYALLQQGAPEKALAALITATDLDPANRPAWKHRAAAAAQLGRCAEARDCYERALKLAPADPATLNDFAWFLATCADPGHRDPPRAVELAAKALKQARPLGERFNTWGVAQYRAGQFDAAGKSLQASRALRGDNAVDFFFLAMTQWRLNRKPEAREWFDKGAAWMKQHAAKDPELIRFRAEAAELLGVKLPAE